MHKYIISLFLLATAIVGRGETIAVTAGDLQKLIGNPASVQSLKLTGTIDATDLVFIESSLPALKSLDISEVTIVPSQGKRVGIASNFNANSIPDNIFAGASFETVLLPNTPGLKIGAGAFAGSQLTEITVPATTGLIGYGAFAACPALKSAVVSCSETGEAMFSRCSALETVTLRGVTTLAPMTFSGCSALANLHGSEALNGIGARAFAGCMSLKTFIPGRTLAAVGDGAFDASGLTQLSLGAATSLTEVGSWAFANMPSLATLDLGNISAMGEGVAFNCPALTTLTVRNVTAIPAYAYAKDDALDSIGILPESVIEIGAYAMSDMTAISTFTLPGDVEYIGDHAMQRMTSLEQITAKPSAVPQLGADVWAGIDQAKVRVNVPDYSKNAYQSAAQWQNFIINGSSSIDDIFAEPAPLEGLRTRFVDYELQVSVEGVEIESLGLYTVGGTLLVYLEPSDGFVAVDTSDFSDHIYIVAATLADGRNASAKVGRR